ncbi:uncharacterized protein LOC126867022 isoform X2 [Bombus huntii]|uniref:uncharacterized protein LOC126867022 isoform X2 n=1 Tax=Bombus huntii TaxID=85661 RepID=UPI0021AA44B1|nr:uncharacterized protein LOC126867022 isoform X2 [Bombus huntii]
MEKLTHLWNVNQFITKLNCSQSRNLQTFYIERCRQYTRGIQPSSQNFGPSVMCPYCGSLWNTIDHSIRLSRGKPLSKSIKKIVHSMNNVCSKSTRISFNKPQREKVQKIRTESIERSKKRKKKRTKDRTAGLNVSGISNLNEKNVQTEELKETNIKKVRSTANFITPTQQKIKMINIDRLKNIINQGATPPKRKSLHSFLTELC